MSIIKDFVKSGDLAFTAQIITFDTNLAPYIGTFGLTPAEVGSITSDRNYMEFVILGHTAAGNYTEGWSKLKKEARKGGGGATLPPFPLGFDLTGAPAVVLPDIEGRFRAIAKRIKSHVNYTPAIGEQLGIEAEETVFDGDNYKTKLTLTLFMGYVRIEFAKKGVDGVNIYSRINGQGSLVFLARDTASPYHDTRPLAVPGTPETREYVAYGVKNDTQLPLASDPVTILFPG